MAYRYWVRGPSGFRVDTGWAMIGPEIRATQSKHYRDRGRRQQAQLRAERGSSSNLASDPQEPRQVVPGGPR